MSHATAFGGFKDFFDEFDTLPETGTDYASAKPKENVEFEKMIGKGTIDQYHTR
jgi:hypothetical protein